MDDKYTNLDKRLKGQNLGYRKEKPSGLVELIVEPDPCKIPGVVCIPEKEFRKDETYKILPIYSEDNLKPGEYRLLPIPRIETGPNINKDIVVGYIYIPGWKGYIPITLPLRADEREIGKYISLPKELREANNIRVIWECNRYGYNIGLETKI